MFRNFFSKKKKIDAVIEEKEGKQNVPSFHWIKQALILSSVLNIIFLSIFFYFFIRENPFPIAFEYAPVQVSSEQVRLPPDIIKQLLPLSQYDLMGQLKNQTLVQDGFRVRDFALAIFGFRDHVDIKRAIGRKNLSERKWKLSEKHEMTLYAGLEESDFISLERFLIEEKWPETSYGLYLKMLKQGNEADPELLQLFCRTQEFLTLEIAFGRSGFPIKKRTLLNLVKETPWIAIYQFLQKQKEGIDFSEKPRREFLLKAVESHAKTAAYLLIITDFEFALRQLDNPHVVAILDLLSHKTAEAVRYAKEMALSMRPDAVRKKAVEKLAQFEVTLKEDELAARLNPRPGIGELRPVFRDKPPASPAPNIHVIQQGESLWLIARKYHVSLQQLMEINQLSSTTTIRPGKTLKIPIH